MQGDGDWRNAENCSAGCWGSHCHIIRLACKGKEQEPGIYRDFYDKVKKAEGMCCLRDLSIITKASIEDWRASAWRLERRYGYTVHQQPQIEVHIDADNISVTQLLGELAATEAKISQLTGPIIDLDEE